MAIAMGPSKFPSSGSRQGQFVYYSKRYQELRMNTHSLETALRKLRSIGIFWAAEQTLEHLAAIRNYELAIVLNMMPPRGRVLEIGAGTGWQASVLKNHGYVVSAIDLNSSLYQANRVWPVTEYDGNNIPFEDGTFDIIYSSNVLEHIPHIYEFQKEIHRVLKPNGVVIHVLPSSSWRFWSNITHSLRCWTMPKAHGEHAGNAISEIHYFSRRWWTRLFRETGWTVMAQDSNRLFYTGYSIMDSRLDISKRSKLSRVLGASCNIFVMRKGNCSKQQVDDPYSICSRVVNE